MNIFILDKDPVVSAQMQCDKHVQKMLLESAQMLSTAHRVLDGTLEYRPTKDGKRKIKYWRLSDNRESTMYKATHPNHPCNIWTRATNNNYTWHYVHFRALCDEWNYRFNKPHKTCDELLLPLKQLPRNIDVGYLLPMPMAMDEEFVDGDTVHSYRNYYQSKQQKMKMAWTRRQPPKWFKQLGEQNVS